MSTSSRLSEVSTEPRNHLDRVPPGRATDGVWKALIAVCLLNALFLLLSIYSAYLPSRWIVFNAQQAFHSGALTEGGSVKRDSKRGFFQYTDCVIIQLLTNDGTPLDDALAPRLYTKNSSWSEPCATLKAILFGDDIHNYEFSGYTRYWHGYLPIAASMLSVFALEDARNILKVLVYCSLLVLAFSAYGASAEIKIFAFSVAGVAALFWALPYFGQALSAPGDAFLMLGIATFLFQRDRMLGWDLFLPFCAAYGAVVTYFEFWTGLLPTAAGFLFVAAYLVKITSCSNGAQRLAAWKFSTAGILAFIGGAALTVAFKQAIALALTDAPALALMAEHLSFYSSGVYGTDISAPAGLDWVWGRLSGLSPLLSSVSTLTFWNEDAAITLAIAVSVAWCGALFLVWHRKRDQRRATSDLLAIGAGASVVPAWAMLFPTHTAMHAVFMSRMLIVPIALGVTALLGQFLPAGQPGRWDRPSS